MPIIVERRGAVQWLTLNRPRARNAIDSETVQQLRTYFENLRDDSETRVVVLRGAGGTFSAGLDLTITNFLDFLDTDHLEVRWQLRRQVCVAIPLMSSSYVVPSH